MPPIRLVLGALMVALALSAVSASGARAATSRDFNAADSDIRPVVDRARESVGARYWRLNGICRGESDPAVYEPACKKRDQLMKRLGRKVEGRFYRAWVRGDRKAMNRLTRGDFAPAGRAARGKPDCSYDPTEPRWLCAVPTQYDVESLVTAEVVRFIAPKVPLWRVTFVVPDV